MSQKSRSTGRPLVHAGKTISTRIFLPDNEYLNNEKEKLNNLKVIAFNDSSVISLALQALQEQGGAVAYFKKALDQQKAVG
jgi:hypothetical protein